VATAFDRKVRKHARRTTVGARVTVQARALASARALGSVVAMVAVAACGSGATPAPTAPATSTVPATTSATGAATIDCGDEAYPCTFADVDPAVTARSEQLAQDVASQMHEGRTREEIESFVRGYDGVAEVESDTGKVRFRLAGGRPEWIVDDPTIGVGAGLGPAANLPSRRIAISGRLGTQVLGSGTYNSIVGPATEAKRALVLSPFLWDFGASDDGAAVADTLRGTRGYADGVVLAANAKPADRIVDIEDFKGWTSDQVVHVASHGVRLCKAGPCRAAIAVRLISGTVGGVFVGTRGFELDPAEASETGVDILHTVNGLTLLALDAAFFRNQYRDGLADTLVFFNACDIFGAQATDLADAIRGTAGEFMGWSEIVHSTAAHDAATALYSQLASGRTAGEAVASIGTLATDPVLPNAQLMLGRPAPNDLRIREIVTATDPQSGQPLISGATLPIQGSLNDAQADDVTWQVSVDGLDAAEAAGATLHVAIDSVAAPPVPVSSGTNAGTHWIVTGVLSLGADLTAPRPATVIASVDLPEGGVSHTETPIVLGGGERPTGTVWTVHVSRDGPEDLGTVATTLTIDATVEFAGTGPGNSLQYLVTDGTYHWTYGPSEAGGCVFSANPVSGSLTPENTAGSLGLAFYVNGSSISWNAEFHFDGDETQRTIECGPDSLFQSSKDTIAASGSVLFPDPLSIGSLHGDGDTGGYTSGPVTVSWTISKVR
jgi:hypothetical protein